MKRIICFIVLFVAIYAAFAAAYVREGRGVYREDLEQSLCYALDESFEELKVKMKDEDHLGSDVSNNEFLAMILQKMIDRKQADVDMRVDVVSLDVKKGFVDIQVHESLPNLPDCINDISIRKTVLLDRRV